jgi:hypothetical protein
MRPFHARRRLGAVGMARPFAALQLPFRAIGRRLPKLVPRTNLLA